MSSNKSSSLNKEINELEEQIRLRRASSSRNFEELQNTVNDKITESQRSFHEKLSAPGTLLTAFGLGFILDRTGVLRSPKMETEKDVEKAKRKTARQQQKKAESTSMFTRLKTIVTLATATTAALSRLDEYMENKKSAEPGTTGSTAKQRASDEYSTNTSSPTPTVSPDNSGQLRP